MLTTNSPEAFAGFIAKEKERWAKAVKGEGIKIEWCGVGCAPW